MSKYIVKKGDTLSCIANCFKVSVTDIQKANASLITDVNIIRVGWVLNIPEKKPSTPKDNKLKEVLNNCINDIQSLDSYKEFMSLL